MTLRSNRNPTLGDVIDLEGQFQSDAARPAHALRERDRAIGRRIGAGDLAPPALYLRWLDEVRDARRSSPGRRIESALRGIGAALLLLGLFSGFALVAGWLTFEPSRPVNVVRLWAATAGLQLLLLVGWCIAILPRRWLRRAPGIDAIHMLLRWLAAALPALLGRIAARFSPTIRETWPAVHDRLARFDHVYGRLRFWTIMRLTALFTLWFNLGMVAAFVAMSYLTDPAFGWRSTLLSESQVQAVADAIAGPWAWRWPEGAPDAATITETRYSSLDERFTGDDRSAARQDRERWAAWWPFMFTSLFVYGLLPRFLTWVVSEAAARRALRRLRFDHAEFHELRDRLTRPIVHSEAASPESADDHEPAAALPRGADVAGGQCIAIKWAGVDLDASVASDLIQRRLGRPARRLLTAGDLDPRTDTDVIEQLGGDGDTAIVLLVEAWEPPVGEYLDFIRAVRGAVGEGRMILVLVHDRDEAGRAIAAPAETVDPWRRQLGRLSDPWLRVAGLIEGEGGDA